MGSIIYSYFTESLFWKISWNLQENTPEEFFPLFCWKFAEFFQGSYFLIVDLVDCFCPFYIGSDRHFMHKMHCNKHTGRKPQILLKLKSFANISSLLFHWETVVLLLWKIPRHIPFCKMTIMLIMELTAYKSNIFL